MSINVYATTVYEKKVWTFCFVCLFVLRCFKFDINPEYHFFFLILINETLFYDSIDK